MSAALETPVTGNPSGCRLVSTSGLVLPLREVTLRTEAGGGIARTVLVQRFANPFAEPLTVTYQVPLPADGAVSGFAFSIGERRVVGEIEGREAARKRYEDAILDGRTAGLLDQERTALFTQTLGNVPPGTEIVAELAIDQPLVFVGDASGSWEWRFPTVVAPRYLSEPGRVVDAERVSVDVADASLPVSVRLSLEIADALRGEPVSPSHALRCTRSEGRASVELASPENARLDRDVVVRWPVTDTAPGVRLERARPAAGHSAPDEAFGLLTIVPPRLDRTAPAVPRDLIVLIDTSGSMSGAPLEQAKAIVAALIESLGDADRLELIAFSSGPEHYRRGAVRASAKERAAALRWVERLRAGGGTEMLTGVRAALSPLRPDAQRQVVLVTDGLIGFEQEVVRAVVHARPAPSRMHVVGVGSSVNRSLTRAVARAGGGAEICVGLGEDAASAARRLVERTALPLVVDVEVSGSALAGATVVRVPDLFAAAPALVGLELRPEGGDLVLRGRTPDGVWEQRLAVAGTAPGEGRAAVCALWARERVEDLEADGSSGECVDSEIERIGRAFSISTRLTSWIAVSDGRTVDATAPIRSVAMPHELPFGMHARGIGLTLLAEPAVGFLDAVLGRSASLSRTARPLEPGFRPVGTRLFSKAPAPSGRVVSQTRERIVIEIEFEQDTAWDPEMWTALRLAPGVTAECRRVTAMSTAAGVIPAGATVRIVLEADAPFDAKPIALVGRRGQEIPLR